MSEIYKKEGKRYVKIAPFEWTGFPMDGIWIVKYRNGRESSASCIARLDDLPEPYPFYNMMLDRDKISHFLMESFKEPVSMQDVIDKFIQYLSQLNKEYKTDRIDKPHKPTFKIPNSERFNGNFKLLEIKKIIKRTNFYAIEFVDFEKKLYVSELTAFVDDKNRGRTLLQLESGNKVWIDVYAYSKDQSLK